MKIVLAHSIGMKKIAVRFIFCAIIFSTLASQADQSIIKFNLICEAQNPNCKKMLSKETGEEIFVESTPVLTINDIISAEIITKEIPMDLKKQAEETGLKIIDDQLQLNLTFSEEGKEKLSNITTKNSGKQMAIIINDALITTPQIFEPIISGKIAFSLPFTQQEAMNLVSEINNAVKQK